MCCRTPEHLRVNVAEINTERRLAAPPVISLGKLRLLLAFRVYP
ncbi:hypothetical protein HMPREF0880_00591 [Yokenella regensburgei ATCC 43003]|nr:hypothetical protein HMPREF0880_00591 [Yokenella regensburgei ATCC 43003]